MFIADCFYTTDIYWCGPMLGGIVAGLFYDFFLHSKASLSKVRTWLACPCCGSLARYIEIDDAPPRARALNHGEPGTVVED